MNGVHDMGGMHGFGPIEPEVDEPVFHQRWEAMVFAMRVAASGLGKWNIDMGRFAVERMPPAEYLAASYYERWLASLETLLLEGGLVTREELESGQPLVPAAAGLRVLRPDAMASVVHTGRRFQVDADLPARFRVGDTVVGRNLHPTGHTRLPRYARGKRGVVERNHGVFIFADTSGSGVGNKPQHLYSVRFAATELWGADAAPTDSVHLDLWDDHLEPAT
jgi:nitrile hydratase